jgi:hypothetical protein
LTKNSHSTTEAFSLKTSSRQPIGLNRTDRFGKHVRPVLAWTVGRNTTRGKKLKTPSDRSPDSFHGLKWDFGDSWGTSWATFGKKLGPQNPLNQEESEVNPQEHLPMETTENIQIEAVSEGLLDQDHQAKGHKDLIHDI